MTTNTKTNKLLTKRWFGFGPAAHKQGRDGQALLPRCYFFIVGRFFSLMGGGVIGAKQGQSCCQPGGDLSLSSSRARYNMSNRI